MSRDEVITAGARCAPAIGVVATVVGMMRMFPDVASSPTTPPLIPTLMAGVAYALFTFIVGVIGVYIVLFFRRFNRR